MPRLHRAVPEIFVIQTPADLSQANPVSGTKYTILDTIKNVRIIDIIIKCTWTVQPTPLELHLTIDGQSITFPFTDPVSNTIYCVFLHGNSPNKWGQLSVTAHSPSRSFLIEGRSVKVEAEITGGTVSNLFARVLYAKRR